MSNSGARPSAPAALTVLHIDDSPENLYRRRRLLESAGFRVLEVTTAAAARRVLEAEDVDLVFADVRLPDSSGFDVARTVKARALASARDVAVILISTYFTESDSRVLGLESGADAYLIEPITDAELVASVGAIVRRIEQLRAARKNERLLDALFEYIPEGIAVADAPDAKISRVSRFGLELTGRPEEELVGIPASEHSARWAILRRDGVTPARGDELPLARAVMTGAIVTDEEWVLRRADGRHLTLLCNAGPIHDGSGGITGGVIAFRDITARKEMEGAMTQLTHELTLADQAKNHFLATVMHELRQPVNASLAALAMMKARRDRPSGERARDVIERQLQQISRIADDLLDATQIVRGQVALDAEPRDLCAIIRRSVETVSSAAAARGLHLLAEIPNAQILISADASRLEQVFVNLLSNAVRYTPSGGTVQASLHTTAAAAVISIRDSGEGIAPERLLRIFDLFVRGGTSQGLGIGLAVAKGLIEAHGGSIEARSEGLGKGAEFLVTLPLS
jgi:signal transduction histidine kinase